MKTYLLNIPNELKKFSQGLDAKALLCSKTWEVLNDEGNKQVFIFQNDGRLLISTNGNVTNSTWQFVTTNNSIVITAEGQTTMLRPAFIDGVIFALQKDGTKEALFLIDEQNKGICPQRALAELSEYFTKKLEVENEAVKQRKLLQEQRERQQRELQHKQQNRQQVLVSHKDEIDVLVKQKKKTAKIVITISSVLFVLSVILLFNTYSVLGFILFFFIVGVSLYVDTAFISRFQTAKEDAEKEIVEKYVNNDDQSN